MSKILKSALVAALLIGSAGAASAAVGIGFNLGNVSIGYSDGYWDNSHHWHNWRRGEMARYRTAHQENFHEWRHDDRHHH